MQLKGKVHHIGGVEQVSDKFKKRSVVIATGGQYPQYIQLECTQDKVALLDSIQVGQEVTAHLNLRGRKWTNKEGVDKYFNTIEAWKIEAGSKVEEQSPFNDDPFAGA